VVEHIRDIERTLEAGGLDLPQVQDDLRKYKKQAVTEPTVENVGAVLALE
jgi:hypothetical protein